MYALHQAELAVIADLGSRIKELELIMQKTQRLEHDIITAKQDASGVYRKAHSMAACLEGQIIEADRKEFLRRVIRLPQVDDSMHLALAKNLIDKYYHEGFSHGQIKDFEEEGQNL